MTRIKHAREIWNAGVQSADPVQSVKRWVESHACLFTSEKFKRVVVTGAGKASAQMSEAVVDVLAQRNEQDLFGHVVTKHGHVSGETRRKLEQSGVKVSEAGHPVPDEHGVLATQQLLQLADLHARQDTLVINLISGGGSALTCLPVESLGLQDVQDIVSGLLASGASIEQMNTVRRHLTLFQGGRFAARFFPATVVSLILSDVIGNDLHVIAGGPTAPDPTTFADCKSVLADASMQDKVPPGVRTFLSRDDLATLETIKPGDARLEKTKNVIVSSNVEALQGAKEKAESFGYETYILTDCLQGEAKEAAKFLTAVATRLRTSTGLCPHSTAPLCLLVGGETTVSLCGVQKDSLGGRNQELALAAAVEIAGRNDITLLSGGTDGGDGPCDAAGAVVDGTLLANSEALAEAKLYLQRHDSYHFFQSTSQRHAFHLLTGPTGTNVMDICVILID